MACNGWHSYSAEPLQIYIWVLIQLFYHWWLIAMEIIIFGGKLGLSFVSLDKNNLLKSQSFSGPFFPLISQVLLRAIARCYTNSCCTNQVLISFLALKN